MESVYCSISQEVDRTGLKPATLVLHKVLSIKLPVQNIGSHEPMSEFNMN